MIKLPAPALSLLLGVAAATLLPSAATGVAADAPPPTTSSWCADAASVAAGRDLSGQVVVTTGGDTGLGLETTKALARTNATVVIGAYNLTHGQQVAAAVAASSGNPKVSARHIDLSDFSSVHAFAASVRADHAAIGTLINDAGLGDPLRSLPVLTVDGYERLFQVNYLGPFLLTQLLLPALRHSSHVVGGGGGGGRRGGRVINVASAASFDACSWANRLDGCLNSVELLHTAATTQNGTLPPSPPPCGPEEPADVVCNAEGTPACNYALTKFAQVAHAMELNAREAGGGGVGGGNDHDGRHSGSSSDSGVRAFSLHPGFVDTPMTRDMQPATAQAWCKPLPYVPGICPITAAAGAATQTYLAVADADELEHGAGGYFVNCNVSESANYTGWIGPAALFDTSLEWLNTTASTGRAVPRWPL